MRNLKLAAIVLSAALALSPGTASAAYVATPGSTPTTPYAFYGIFACSLIVVLAAMNANRVHNRPLNSGEASTCGVTYWVKPN